MDLQAHLHSRAGHNLFHNYHRLQRHCFFWRNMPSNVPTYKAAEARADELRRERKKKTKNDVVVRLASLVHQVRGPCAAQCNSLDCVQATSFTSVALKGCPT